VIAQNKKVPLFFLNDEKDWRATSPSPTPIYFHYLSDQNIEIAIFFSIVEILNNYVFRNKMSPLFKGIGMQIMKFAHCLLIVFVIGKYTGTFFGDDFFLGGIFIGKIFLGEANFQGGV